MRTQWRSSLTTTLGDEWLTSRLDRLTSREAAYGTGWLACSVELMAGLDALEKRKICRPWRESNCDSSAGPRLAQ